MKSPASTYRVQLSPEFTFQDLRDILDYLEQLNISTIYAAPFFMAREGSTHGYDITDPLRVNNEIGSLEEFREIKSMLREKKMTWLQDIVPNHMAYDNANIWLGDILEFGPLSPYFHFFDINWKKKKVMAPFLGAPLQDVLKKSDLSLKLDQNGFTLNYFDNFYALSLHSYSELIPKKETFTTDFKEFKAHEEGKEIKKRFLKKVKENANFRNEIEEVVKDVNASEEKLRKILEMQYFEPVHWKTTEEKINYRRFFTINDLLCLRMEEPIVFQKYHSFINDLVDEGLVDGLRIDHIDGLFNPLQYLKKLRTLVGNDTYLVIEKILEWDEKLPAHWPVEGTSGYAFLAAVNQLMTDYGNESIFTEKYQQISPENADYEKLIYNQKLFILKERMGGEYDNLWKLAIKKKLLEKVNSLEKCKRALGVFLAAFPVYRIYPEEFPLQSKEREYIEQAGEKALQQEPMLAPELETWKQLFLGEAGKNKESMIYFLQRCQQFTGPLAAKGVEDTCFYIYNRLISHNEVGDSPEYFGISGKGFHKKMLHRNKDFPLSINATATHDTKRGEDARMRINVLSEIGEEWFLKVEEWLEITRRITPKEIPDPNEAYFIFQMLIGSFPFDLEPRAEFLERSKSYLQKVLREAKEHSSWAEPEEEYETAIFEYLEHLLKDDKFLSSFLPFQKKIMAFGVIKSLAQCLLKITAPGIPDIYQGTELWDLSYVDPDNRRPVDYKLRKKYLSQIQSYTATNLPQELENMKRKFASGKIKMYCLIKALEQRRKFPQVFEKGEYIPIEVRGAFQDRVLAYGRKEGEDYFLIVVPLKVTQLFLDLEPIEEHDTEPVIKLPEDFPTNWINCYTGLQMDSSVSWTMRRLFGKFPVALLKNT